MNRILLVDDEEAFQASLAYTLRKAGYHVSTAADGPSALRAARTEMPDLILLDLMLPGIDGLEICRRVREHSDVPILILSARGDLESKISGFDLGADDYVTKPFSSRELLARVEAMLRRREGRLPALTPPLGEGDAAAPLPTSGSLRVPRAGMLEAGPVRLDLDRHEAWLCSRMIELSPKEYDLLRVFLTYAGRAVARQVLIDTVWGDDFMGDDKTLDVHIRWLRAKIEPDPGNPRHIITVRGVGYRFDE